MSWQGTAHEGAHVSVESGLYSKLCCTCACLQRCRQAPLEVVARDVQRHCIAEAAQPRWQRPLSTGAHLTSLYQKLAAMHSPTCTVALLRRMTTRVKDARKEQSAAGQLVEHLRLSVDS